MQSPDTTRSSDLAASARSDYSAWLDAIFQPPRSTPHPHRKELIQDQDGHFTQRRPHRDTQLMTPCSFSDTKKTAPPTQCASNNRYGDHTHRCSGSSTLRRSRRVHAPAPRRSSAELAPHPAAFSDVRYERCSHRPGLRFFEHLPALALIHIASTLVFVDAEAATRIGGEVVWIRTDNTGRVKRRVFSTAECLGASTRLRRRVALSLRAQDSYPSDGLAKVRSGIIDRSMTARGWRWRRRQCRGPGTAPIISGELGRSQPVALVKISECTRSGGRDGTEKPEIVLLHTISQIEELVIREAQTSDRQIQDAPTGQDPKVMSSPVAQTTHGEAAPCHAEQTSRAKQSALYLDSSMRNAEQTEASTGPFRTPLMSKTEKARPRPWAIQAFIKPKGPLAWMVRAVWQRGREPFCWILSDSDPFVTRGFCCEGATGNGQCNAVRSMGNIAWAAPKATVSELVKTLESSLSLRFGELVADLIEDCAGKWWLTQVKAFRLLDSSETRDVLGSKLTPTSRANRGHSVDGVSAIEVSSSRSSTGGADDEGGAVAAVGGNRSFTGVAVTAGSLTQGLDKRPFIPTDVVLWKRDACPGKFCREANKSPSSFEGGEDVQGEDIPSAVVGANKEAAAHDAFGGMARADGRSFELPLKALVVVDEVSRLRQKIQQKGDGILAHPTSADGASEVEESVCDVEARALKELLKRDRMQLYDRVRLCPDCYQQYSYNWRWWLGRGGEKRTGTTRVLEVTQATTGQDKNLLPRRRRGRPKEEKINNIDTTAKAGIDVSDRTHFRASYFPRSNAPLSLWLSERDARQAAPLKPIEGVLAGPQAADSSDDRTSKPSSSHTLEVVRYGRDTSGSVITLRPFGETPSNGEKNNTRISALERAKRPSGGKEGDNVEALELSTNKTKKADGNHDGVTLSKPKQASEDNSSSGDFREKLPNHCVSSLAGASQSVTPARTRAICVSKDAMAVTPAPPIKAYRESDGPFELAARNDCRTADPAVKSRWEWEKVTVDWKKVTGGSTLC